MLLEKTLESLLDSKKSKLVSSKGYRSLIVIGKTDAETETPVLLPPDAKSWLTGKDRDAGKDWTQEKRDDKGWVGWMASPTQGTWVWASSRRGWKGSLACCSPRNGRVGMTYQLNNNNKRAINTFSWTQYHLFSTEGHLLLYISYLNSDNHTSLLACDSPRKSLLCQAAWAEWCLGSPPAQRGEESW